MASKKVEESVEPFVAPSMPIHRQYEPLPGQRDLFGDDEAVEQKSRNYLKFLDAKTQLSGQHGFSPLWMPDFLKDFQKSLTEWAILKGRAALFADCGMGKAERVDQKILTDCGWIEIGSAKVGMKVVGSDGDYHNIVGVYPQGVRQMADVEFSDGTHVICDWDHLWYVQSQQQIYHDRPGRVLKTIDILKSGIKFSGGQKKHFIPLIKPIPGIESNHLIDPYTLGVAIGDGSLTGGTCQVDNPELNFRDGSLPLPDGCQWSEVKSNSCPRYSIVSIIRPNPFTEEIKRIGLHGKKSEHKFVPKEYINSSIPVRIAVLQGLLDTDGYATGPCIEFCTSSSQLSDDVVFIVRSLGGTATQSREKSHYTKGAGKVECLDKYRSIIKLPKGIEPFRLSRKSSMYNPVQRKAPLKSIVSITESGEGEAVCIRIDSSDSLYVTEGMTLTHNTPMSLVWAENVVRRTNKPVLILTPLAVSHQFVTEGEKFGIECKRCPDGKVSGPKIYVVNYERLHYFDKTHFAGVVCDESSCLKNFAGKIKSQVTDFTRKIPHRLLGTATASPNDYPELGTSSEALGELGYMDMLGQFFKNDGNTSAHGGSGNDRSKRFSKTPFDSKWRFKPHAEQLFWRWVCSWARACRRPSDLGFDDSDFVLPPLVEREHVVKASRPMDGYLFSIPAKGLKEQRDERRHTLLERCEYAAKLIESRSDATVSWCHLNDEADLLESIIPGGMQVSGSMSDEKKEERLLAFQSGELRNLIIKPAIGAWGLNWQHCHYMTIMPSYSFEQYYQSIRRCWRFGQKSSVEVDVVTTEGEDLILKTLRRKAAQAEKMFDMLVAEMRNEMSIARSRSTFSIGAKIPSWMQK